MAASKKKTRKDSAKIFFTASPPFILIPNQLMTDELIWKKSRALRVGRNIKLRYSDSKSNYGSL
jgi:hypothetical protein